MRSLRPVGIVVFTLGLALGAFLPSDSSEVSAQGAKGARKSNAPKAPKVAKAPKAAMPRVQKAPMTHVKPQNGSAAKRLPEPQKKSNEQLSKALHVLKSVNKTLIAADHDYGGHRAAAVRDIGKAESGLHAALNHQGAKAPAVGPDGGISHNPPQRYSNAELRSKLGVLHKTIATLEHADHDYGGHRAQAVGDLKAAAAQLKTALQYVK